MTKSSIKSFFATTLLFLFVLPAFAINDNFYIELEQETGVFGGHINEWVFDEDENGKQVPLSKLDWEMPAIPYIGLKIATDTARYLHIDFNLKYGIPIRSGCMQDYDWIGTDKSILTNYSWHENYLKNYLNFSLNFGGNIYLPAEFKITPMFGFEYEEIFFSGENGYLSYASRNWIIEPQNGQVISYYQTFSTMHLGLAVKTEIVPRTDMGLSFFVLPDFSLDAIDTHVLRSTMFWDILREGILLKGDTHAFFKFNNMHRLGIKGGIQYLPLMTGMTRSKKTTGKTWGTPAGIGGSNRFMWNAAIVYELKL